MFRIALAAPAALAAVPEPVAAAARTIGETTPHAPGGGWAAMLIAFAIAGVLLRATHGSRRRVD